MATFIPTSNSRVGKTGYSGFTPTKNAGYKQSTLFGWQQQNKAALDILNRYNEIIKNGGWMSTDDRASYKAALDSYTYSSRALRNASEFYGATYTPEERNSWKNSFSQMNKGYDDITGFYSQFSSEDEYKQWYEFEHIKTVPDFEEYAQAGAGVANPDWNKAHAPVDIFGWTPLGDGETINNMVTFAEANKAQAGTASAQALRGGGTSKYGEIVDLINSYMTDEEKGIYNYYVGKGDTGKANEYLSYITDILRQRQAGKIVEQVDDTALELVFSFGAGTQSGFQGLGNFVSGITGNEGASTSTLQYAHGMMSQGIEGDPQRQGNKGVWKAVNDLAYTTGNMTPSLLAGTIAGPVAGKAVGSIVTGISSAGNSYAEMIKQGYGVDQARKYGVMVGTAEGGLSYLFGGISKIGGKVTGSVISKAIDGIDNGIARFFVEFAISTSSEALEEGAQAILDPVFKMIATGEDFEGIDWSEVGYSAMLGGLSAGLLEGVPNAANSIHTNYKTNVQHGGLSNMGAIKALADTKSVKGVAEAYKTGKQNVTESAGYYVNEALEIDPDNAYAQRMQARINDGKNVSGSQINRIVDANQKNLTTQDKGKIRSAVETRLSELGETGNVSQIAEAITKRTTGQALTSADKQALSGSKQIVDNTRRTKTENNSEQKSRSTIADRVFNELQSKNIESGEYSSAWAESIGTDIVNADAYNRRQTPETNNVSSTNTNASTDNNVPVRQPLTRSTSDVVVKTSDNKSTTSPIRSIEVKDNVASFKLDNGKSISADKAVFKTENHKAVADIAIDKMSRVEGFSNEAATAMIKGYDGNISPTQYDKVFTEAFKAGKEGASTSMVRQIASQNNVSEPVVFAAYDIGREFSNSVLKSSSKSDTINIENTEATNESRQSIPVRESSKWLAGANSEGQVSRMEGSTGQAEIRSESGRYADGEVAGIVNKGREVRVSDLGILGGSEYQKVRILDNVEETADMKAGREYAEARGLKVRYYAGDALTIESKRGTIEKVNAYILGNNVIVRATSPDFTSKQLVRHEVGHDMIAKGEVNIDKVRARVKEIFKSDEEVDQIAKYYEEAYANSGLNEEEIWEEVICDSLGDMNIFAKSNNWAEAAVHVGMTIPAIQQAVAETKVEGTQQTRGSPDSTAVYNTRDGSNGWGSVYGTAQEALNDAIARVDSNLSSAFTEEISTEKEHYAISDAIIAVQEDVRQDTITPIQGAKLLSEVYQRGGAEALDRLYNHETGNLHPKALERAKQYSTSADEAMEGKASRETLNEGEQYGNEDQDSRVLGGQVLSAVSEGKNNQRNGSNDSQNVRASMARNGITHKNVSRNGDNGRNASGYLARTDIVSPSSFSRYKESVLRALEGKLADRDSSGRRIPQEIKEKFKDTVLKNENGELLSVYHWTSKIFDVFSYGDIGFHFGTYEAAIDRREGRSNETGADRVKDVYLNIKNPIFLEDWGRWDAYTIAMQLFEKGLIDYDTILSLKSNEGYMSQGYDLAASKAMRNLLDNLGYDGIIYQNAIEGKGLSIAALYPNQIYTVSEESVGQKGKASRELDIDSEGNELSKEQQEYFKDSKVRDENGNLLVVYHGSSRGKITVFDKSKTSKINDMGQGLYFSSDAEDASTYMGETKSKKLYQAYLNITAPFVVSDNVNISLDEARSLLKLSDNRYAANDVFWYLTREAKDGFVTTSQLANSNISQQMADMLIKSGNYDGIIDETVADKWGLKKGTKHYVALESNQIKDVGNKNPTDNPNIHYSRELELDYDESAEAGKTLTNRELLANALESATTSQEELEKLREYKKNIQQLNKKTFVLGKLKEEIKQMSFGKRQRDTAKLAELKEKAAKLERSLNYYDRQLVKLEAMKPVKDLVQRERSKAYKAAAEKGRENLHRNIEGRNKTAERHAIKALKDKFIKMMDHPTDRQYIPANLISAMVDVCQMIDTDTDLYKADGSINKAQQKRNEQMERLLKLRDEYAALGKNPDPMYSGEFDQDILDYLDELRQDYTGKSLNEMTLVELKEFRHILRAIDETLQDARKLIGWGEADSVYDAGDRIISDQRAITEKRKGKGEKTAVSMVIDNSISPLRNVKRMADYKADSPLVKSFRDLELGVRKKNKFAMDAYKSFETLTSGENAKKFEDAIYKPFGKEYVDKEGRKFHVSKMQMMQAIMSYNRELANDKLKHVSEGGFTFADLDLLNKGNLKEAIDPKNAHSVSFGAALAMKFQSELASDSWAQEYMKTAEQFFDGTAKDAINEANMTLKHRIIATGSKYIPYEVNKDFVVREITSENDIQQTISGYGMMKDLKDGATQPLIITGLNNILERHIDQVSNIHGLAVPVRNFNKVWNVKAQDGSTTVQEAIKRNFGDRGAKVMIQAVKDVQGSRIKPEWERVYSAIKGNVIGATFMGNGSVVTKQVGSLFTATAKMKWRDPVSMIGNLLYTMANYKKISAEVDKYTASAWMRRQGMSDAELHSLTTEAKKKGVVRLVSKLPTAINPTKWISGMDSMVALSLWTYAKADVAKQTGLSGEDLNKAAAEYYDDIIENTQSMSDALHRPEIQKSGGVISETLGTFKTDLYQGAGLMADALGEYRANPTKENANALAKAVTGNVMSAVWGSIMTTAFALLRYKVNRYRDDEDDEIDAESWLKVQGSDLAGDLVGYIVPLFGGEVYDIVSAVIKGEQIESFDNMVLETINDFVNACVGVGNAVRQGDWANETAYKKLINSIGSIFGVPISNMTRLWEAINLHAQDIANGELGSFEAGLTSANNTRLYRAYIEGDADKINKASRLYKDEAALKADLRKGLRENDPRLREAAIAKLNGDTATYKRLCEEVIAEGKFDRTIIIDAFAAEYNYHNTKKKEAEAEGKTYP